MSMSGPATERPRDIASFAVDLVVALGARAAFSLTGGMAMYLNRAVGTHPGLSAVYNQHEQACANAADGYAKASDFQAPGLAVVTAGPGVTNTITSLCSAFGDSSPVVVLAGQIKTPDIDRLGTRTYGIQEVRSQAIVSPCVKRFTRLSQAGFGFFPISVLSIWNMARMTRLSFSAYREGERLRERGCMLGGRGT